MNRGQILDHDKGTGNTFLAVLLNPYIFKRFKVVGRRSQFQDGRKHPSGTELSPVQQHLLFCSICTRRMMMEVREPSQNMFLGFQKLEAASPQCLVWGFNTIVLCSMCSW